MSETMFTVAKAKYMNPADTAEVASDLTRLFEIIDYHLDHAIKSRSANEKINKLISEIHRVLKQFPVDAEGDRFLALYWVIKGGIQTVEEGIARKHMD